jgi:hypothetical protein
MFFLQAGLVTVGNGPAGALTVAFVGGFSERLIVRVAESIAGDKRRRAENPPTAGNQIARRAI